MKFSDIVFNDIEGALLLKVEEYFQDAKSVMDEDAFSQMHYKVFVFCTYLGFTVVDNDEIDLYDMERVQKREKFSIPRTVLGQHVSRIKELLICAHFINEKYNVLDEDLQSLWSQESYRDNPELTQFIKKSTIIGARYFASMIDAGLDISISYIQKDIFAKLNEFKNSVDINKMGNDILLESSELF